jgi:polyferredoxin
LNLAKIRIAISSLVFILFLSIFFGGEKLSVLLSPIILPLQFVPAIIHAFTKPETIAIFCLVLLIVVSLIFGRIYCSFLCPLGTMQDIFIAVSRKTGRRRNNFQKPGNWLRYSLFILTFISAVYGITALLNLLDPYSLWSRIATNLFEDRKSVV